MPNAESIHWSAGMPPHLITFCQCVSQATCSGKVEVAEKRPSGHMSAPDLFPYPAARRGQEEFLRDAREALAQGSILVAQAPTGLGKTAVALASALECALEHGKKVLFTTSRRSQHVMAIETLRQIRELTELTVVDMIARESMCDDHSHHPVRHRGSRIRAVSQVLLQGIFHVQEVVELSRRFGVCAYTTGLRAAKQCDVLVCDYNYLFSQYRETILKALGFGLPDCIMIVDEAHNLPSRARAALSGRMSGDVLLSLADACGGEFAGLLRSISGLLRAEAKVVGGESKVPSSFLARLLRRYASSRPFPTESSLADALEQSSANLTSSLRHQADETLLVLREWQESNRLRLLSPSESGSLALLALDPRPATAPVFREVHGGMLMSGTLHPGQMYVDILGIPQERVALKSYPSNFPPENRLLAASQRVSSSYRGRPDCYRLFAREIYDLCFVIPGNFAAFFPSYEMARRVGEILHRLEPPKALLWERRGQSKAEKEGLLRVLKRSGRDPGCLLMAIQGASLSEGMDYPGNLLSGVVVAGLALNPPDLRVEALRAFYAKMFGRRRAYEYAYLYPALNKLVQCAGRCIRSPDDVAAVVVLDNRLLRTFYKSRLPAGFDPVAPTDLAGAVRSFFYARQDEKYIADQARGGGRPEPHRVDGSESGGEAESPKGLPTLQP